METSWLELRDMPVVTVEQVIRFRSMALTYIKELESQIISGFYENEFPEYYQGIPNHELLSIVTAEELNNLVKRLGEPK